MKRIAISAALSLVIVVLLIGTSHRTASADTQFPLPVASINVTNAQSFRMLPVW